MTRPASRLPMAVALLLLAAGALFAIGVGVEHTAKASEPKPTATSTVETHAQESDQEQAANGENVDATQHSEGHVETDGERILGIRTDSAAAVSAMLLASVLLAAAVWSRPKRAVIAAAGAFAAAATVFDIAEAVHQHTEGRTNVLLIAAVVAAAHLAVVAIALAAIGRGQPAIRAPAS